MYLSNFLKIVKLETSPCDLKKKWCILKCEFLGVIYFRMAFIVQFLGERLAFFWLEFPLKYQEPAAFSNGENEELELGGWWTSEGWRALSFKEQIDLLCIGQNFVQHLDAVHPKMSVAHLGIAVGREEEEAWRVETWRSLSQILSSPRLAFGITLGAGSPSALLSYPFFLMPLAFCL